MGRLEADWSDGHHELALELGEPDDDRIDRAMAALDDVPELDGWWSSRDPQDRGADRLPARLSSVDGRGQMYGMATLAQGPRTVCVAYALREGDGAGPDWLMLGFPMGALVRVLADVGVHPYRGDRWDPSAPWRRSLDDWLAEVGRTVYAAAPFRLGLIGFEVGGLLPLDPAYLDPPQHDRWGSSCPRPTPSRTSLPPSDHAGGATAGHRAAAAQPAHSSCVTWWGSHRS